MKLSVTTHVCFYIISFFYFIKYVKSTKFKVNEIINYKVSFYTIIA